MKGLRITLVFSLLLTFFGVFSGIALAEKGDCDHDGNITSVDALIALQMSIGKTPEDLIADMDGDGKVTSFDAFKILLIAVGSEEKEDLFEELDGLVDVYNQNAEKIPPFIRNIAGNDRINWKISLKDGNTLIIGMKTKEARVEKFERGPISNPTINAYTTEETIRQILNSEDPASAFQDAWTVEK